MTTFPPGQPPDIPPTPRPQALAAFRYHEYRLFWLGGVFSNLGMWSLIAGRLWLMNNLSESALMLGLVTMSSLGPILVFSMWGGVIADRMNRLRLVTSTRVGFAAMAVLTGILYTTDVMQPWHLLTISLATGVLLSFDMPARQAMISNLVRREHLVNAISLYSLLFGGSAIIGPIFFAPVVNNLGLDGLFFLIGGAYALTAVVMLLMRVEPHRVTSKHGRLWQELLEGIGYVRGHQVLVSLMLMGIIMGMFGLSFRTLLPIFADQVLKGGVESYGDLLLAAGLGGLAGTMFLAWWGNLKNSARFLLPAGVGFGLGLAIFSQISWLPGSMIAIGVVGAFGMIFITVNTTLVQSLAAEEYRGRVMSIHLLVLGTTAIGGLILSFLAEQVDAPFALTLGGLVTAGAMAIVAVPALRRITAAA